jgi:uncharacterized coiled-coil protein SlyX
VANFDIRIDHYFHHVDDGVTAKLDQILAALAVMQQKEDIMSAELDALTAQVAANTDLEKSAITLIEGLAAQFAAVAQDPAKVTALAAQLKSSADALSAAITANTPPPAPPAAA